MFFWIGRSLIILLLYVLELIFAVFTLLVQLILLIDLVKTDKLLKSDVKENKDKNVESKWLEKFIDEYLELSKKGQTMA